jgi:outer membrane protein assembly factor BamB
MRRTVVTLLLVACGASQSPEPAASVDRPTAPPPAAAVSPLPWSAQWPGRIASLQSFNADGDTFMRVGAPLEIITAASPTTYGALGEGIARLGPNGAPIFVAPIPSDLRLTTFAAATDGGVLVIGDTQRAPEPGELFAIADTALTSFGPDGQRRWQHRFTSAHHLSVRAATAVPGHGVALVAHFVADVHYTADPSIAAIEPRGRQTTHIDGRGNETSERTGTLLTLLADDGRPRWSRSLAVTAGSLVTSISASARGQIALVGACLGAGASSEDGCRGNDEAPFVALWAADGTPLWLRTLGGEGRNRSATTVAILDDGGVAVGGDFLGTMTDGPTPVIAAEPMRDGFVARYDASGTLRWIRHLRGASEAVLRVVPAPAGGTWVYAEVSAELELGDGYTYTRPDGRKNNSVLLACYSADGVVLSLTLHDRHPDPNLGQPPLTAPWLALGGISGAPDGSLRLSGTFVGDVLLPLAAPPRTLSSTSEHSFTLALQP